MVNRRNPFEEIEHMLERMTEQFEGVGEGTQLGTEKASVDVAENDDEVTVTADLPGFDKDDIDISIRDAQLTIQAQREEETETGDEDATYHRRERTQRQVSRTLRLPTDVNEEAANASYQNGVLTVTLPKTEAGVDGHSIDVE